MGIFDKGKGKSGGLLPGAGSPSALRDQIRLRGQQGMRQMVVAERIVYILLDGTESMDELIANAKRSLRSVIDRVYHLVPAGVKIKMKIVIYRDYASGPQLVESSPLSEDPELLCGYLSHVETSGGEGNGAEAVEAGLEEALRDPASRPHLIFVAGDEQAHEAEDFLYQWKDNRYPQGDRTITPGPDDIVRVESDPYCRRTAEQIAQQCAELSIPIHTLVVGHDKKCIRSFKQIAKLSGGTSGMLDGSDAMRDMMCMAILANLASASVGAEELIQRYLTKYGGSDGRALSPEAKVFGRNLLAGRK